MILLSEGSGILLEVGIDSDPAEGEFGEHGLLEVVEDQEAVLVGLALHIVDELELTLGAVLLELESKSAEVGVGQGGRVQAFGDGFKAEVPSDFLGGFLDAVEFVVVGDDPELPVLLQLRVDVANPEYSVGGPQFNLDFCQFGLIPHLHAQHRLILVLEYFC